MSDTTLIVPDGAARQRLDVFLAQALKVSRAQAQKLITAGYVTDRGVKPNKPGWPIKAGDKIVVRDAIGPRLAKATAPSKGAGGKPAKPGPALTPKVIAATPSYLVVEKPKGLLTHPTLAGETKTLASWLLKKYPKIKNVGDAPNIRPGIVHRLDKEASGLLIVARTQEMFNHLKDQFKNRTVLKEYWALAHGRVAKDWGEIQFPIARGQTGRMAARPIRSTVILSETKNLSQQRSDPFALLRAGSSPRQGGVQDDSGEKTARTEFLVERRFVNFTLLRITLHTGRMHQIRVHLLAYNHPLVGDPLYLQKKRPHKWDDKLGRLFLHATKLSFTDLKGERQTFESPLPKELVEFLKLLK